MQKINTLEFLEREDLRKCLLVGYYGGGNLGDELLLEVLLRVFSKRGEKDVRVLYQNEKYRQYHEDYGYTVIPQTGRLKSLWAFLTSRSILIGGGGLWGVDTHLKILLLSFVLLFGRLLGKRIYLVSVGYYLSTNRIGHVSAYIVSKIAKTIIARDEETFQNFFAYTPKNVVLDKDISLYLKDLVGDGPIHRIEENASIRAVRASLERHEKTVVIALRHFRYRTDFDDAVQGLLPHLKNTNVIVCLFQPASQDPAHEALMESWKSLYPNVQTYYYAENPLLVYALFKEFADKILLIAPQYHAIALALLADVTFFPLVYDNKVAQLLKRSGNDAYQTVDKVKSDDLLEFLKRHGV